MTTAPKYPLRHTYEGENPFDIVDSAWGSIERWRAQALTTGEVGAMTVLNKHIRQDSMGIIARHDAREATLDEREALLTARELKADERERMIDVSAAKIDALVTRLEKAKADAEEEPLPLPPGLNSELPDPLLNAASPSATDASLPGDPLTPSSRSENSQGTCVLVIQSPVTNMIPRLEA